MKKTTSLVIIFGLLIVACLPALMNVTEGPTEASGAPGGPSPLAGGDLVVNGGATKVIENYGASSPYGQKGDVIVEGKKHTALPQTKDASDDTGDSILDFQDGNDDYVVEPGETMYIDTFNTAAITIPSNKIGAVRLMVRYSTGGNVSAGYAGSNSVQWALEGDTLGATTITPYNTTGNNATGYFHLFPMVNSVAKAQDLDVQFNNNDGTYNVFIWELELQVFERSTLSIQNSTFVMSMDTSHKYTFNVKNGGLLRIEDSTLTVDVTLSNPYFNLFMDFDFANFEVENSILEFPGGINITNGNFSLINSEIIALSPPHSTKGCADLNFDNGYVYFENSIVKTYLTGKDIDLAGSTKFIGIDTYLDIDFNSDSIMELTGTSMAYLYNVTTVPPSYPPFTSVINVASSSAQANVYRWLIVNVTDRINVRLGNANVTAKFSDNTSPDPSTPEVLAYLGITTDEYVTDGNGQTILPLLTDELTQSSMPNSDYVGNYKITAELDATTLGTINIGLPKYPHIEEKDNVQYKTVSSSTELISPLTNPYYTTSNPSDIIISSGTSSVQNSKYQKPSGGVVDTFGQKGNIIINGTGTLIIDNSIVGLEQDANNKYFILVEESGTLKIKSGTIRDGFVSSDVVPINIYLFDNAKLVVEQGTKIQNLGALAARAGAPTDSINITISDSNITGNIIDAVGSEIMMNINSGSSLDINSLILDDTQVQFQDSIIMTESEPQLNGANITAINTDFNQDLTFSTSYNVTLINVNEPSFFNISAVGSTIVHVYWRITVNVKDSKNNPLSGAEVYVWNYTQSMQKYPIAYNSDSTDLNGQVTFDVLGGLIDSAGHWFGGNIGNYYINASYLGAWSDDTGSGDFDVFGSNQNVDIIIDGAPDLVINSNWIIYEPSEPLVETQVNITVTVQNQGKFGASNVYVRFFDQTANKQIVTDEYVPVIDAGSSEDILVYWVPQFAGEHTIKVSADPQNMIGESSEGNNNATKKILIGSPPTFADLIVESIQSTPDKPSTNTFSKLNATIRNIGFDNAGSFVVQFFDGDPDNGGSQIGSDHTVDFLEVGGSANVEVNWFAGNVGDHDIYVRVDPEVDETDSIIGSVNEDNETNNLDFTTIKVVKGADLTLYSTDILTDPLSPITREDQFIITANIRNIGGSSASDINVRFYLNSFENPIGDYTIGYIQEGDTGLAILPWSVMDEGPRKIYVYVDPNNNISESDEKNNWNETSVKIVKKADLEIQDKDILVQTEPVPNSVNVTVFASVRNKGETDAYDVIVRFFYQKKGSDVRTQIGGDIIIETFTWNTILNISVIWNIDTGGDYDIIVKVIPTDEDLDETMSNNEGITKDIHVLKKADLIINSSEITVDPSTVIGLFESFTITVPVYNDGDSNIRNARIGFYEGEPAVGGKLLEEIVIDPFKNGTREDAVYTGHPSLFPSGPDGTHSIYIVADHKNEIIEENEFNNIGTIDIIVKTIEADLAFPDDVFVLNGEAVIEGIMPTFNNGSTIDVSFTISNEGYLDAINFTVDVFDGDPDANGKKIFNVTIDHLGFSSELVINLTSWIPDRSGERDLYVELNRNRLINETQYKNNAANITIKILESELSLISTDIIFSTKNLNAGDNLDIHALVENKGEIPQLVKVVFFDEDPDTNDDNNLDKNVDQYIVGEINININPGLRGNATTTYENILEGTYKFYVWVDPYNVIPESNDGNNLAESSYVTVGAKSEDKEEDELDFFMIMSLLMIIIIVVVIIVVVYFMVIVKKRKETMAECSECGNLMPLDATVCEKCGAEFTDEVECGECGAIMSVTDTTCPECGAEFKKALDESEVEGGKKEKPPKGGDVMADNAAAPAPGKPSAPAPATPAAPKVKKGPSAPAAPAAAAAPAAPAATEGEEEMIECYQCGATVPLSAPMCPECGAEFE